MCLKNTPAPGSNSNKNLSDVPRSETFVFFTKIKTATWYINTIIPVYIALKLIDHLDAKLLYC